VTTEPWRGLASRPPLETDHARIVAAAETWWGAVGGPTGAQQRAALLPRLFPQHFADTSLVLEDAEGDLAGFLVGFLSQSQPKVAYIHFVGVAPELRRAGAAKVRCITSPGNSDSIAFHDRIGFCRRQRRRVRLRRLGPSGQRRARSRSRRLRPLDRLTFIEVVPLRGTLGPCGRERGTSTG